MSEELYNSNDYCSLAEELEELKKENTELSRDKERLMDLFMEHSEYIFDVVANMKIESLTRNCKALKDDYEISNREMLIMQVEIGRLKSELARRDEIIARLKEDGERLSEHYAVYEDGQWICKYCKCHSPGQGFHAPDCPITLHRALMKELEAK